ncbi:MAG TPA: VapC toxin family PIN domain ribonuclease [Lentisphaeria bacterium]|nr:MAG: hypothetical protein A2X45_01440 [Lentisphaerae bacterium GWF2_50_93]HCE45222.1 VapC toxin family PIN domain ribonuclease [Lentisphaeria bacterium]
MNRVLIDTNVYSRGLVGDPWSKDILRQSEELLMCPIVAGELFSGFKNGSRNSHNRSIFQKFLASPRVTVISMALETSEFYSVVLEQLRNQGTPIPTNDIWIAACAMEHGAHLATTDNHFRHIKGLLAVFPEES